MKNGNWRINRSSSLLPKNKRDFYQKIRLKTLNALGGKCIRCNFEDERALQVDHVNSDGSIEYKKYSGVSFFYHVLKHLNSNRYQVLCANCNWIKRREKEECGKKYDDDHQFPKEEFHIRVFKEKTCKRCCNTFKPTNGRQIYCNNLCVKG